MSKNTITITAEQFNNAVMKANANCISIVQKVGNANPMTIAMTGTQNMAFAIELSNVLFEESEDEE